MEADHPLDGLTLHQWSVLERLGEELVIADQDQVGTLTAVLVTTLAVVADAAWASVCVFARGQFIPQAMSNDILKRLDAVQVQLKDGPAIRSASGRLVVRIDDFADDSRWPAYNEMALSIGIQSLLCLPLFVDGTRLGSMSIYADRPRAFDVEDERVATLCATHASLVLSGAQRAENLLAAIASRDTIGMAKGVLMERLHVTADAAFVLLSERSQSTGRKLAEVAARVVETGSVDA